jgi:hypothetical protein
MKIIRFLFFVSIGFCFQSFDNSKLYSACFCLGLRDIETDELHATLLNNEVDVIYKKIEAIYRMDIKELAESCKIFLANYGKSRFSEFIQKILLTAIGNNNPKVFSCFVEIARENKIDLNFCYENDKNLLMLLADAENTFNFLIPVLCKAGVSLDHLDSGGYSVLLHAIVSNNTKAIKFFVDQKKRLSLEHFKFLERVLSDNLVEDDRMSLGFHYYLELCSLYKTNVIISNSW